MLLSRSQSLVWHFCSIEFAYSHLIQPEKRVEKSTITLTIVSHQTLALTSFADPVEAHKILRELFLQRRSSANLAVPSKAMLTVTKVCVLSLPHQPEDAFGVLSSIQLFASL